MVLSASDAFKAYQDADVNRPVTKVQLVLGNYASKAAYGSTTSSNGDDGSGNFPADGAIDGDRTELNVGAASGADNDVGKSSWRSSVTPSIGTPAGWRVTFTTARKVNRVKLYHLSGHGLKEFVIKKDTGAAVAGTTSFAAQLPAGTSPFVSTGKLDVIDFAEVSTTFIEVDITDTQVVSDKANIVECEVYRLVDITERVKSVTIRRNRDYKLANPMAAVVDLECLNADRFFSFSHTPTATERSLFSFVNDELQPEIGVIIQLGYDLQTGGNQYVPSFVGTVDRLTVKPKSRDAVISARDPMKTLINRIDSSKLKTTIDIGSAIQYVLNRSNISTYETSLDSTGINIDYFFSDNQDPLSTIRDLVQAAGDALFYFDENGLAVFKSYAGQTPNDHLYTSEIDWEAGTRTGIDTTTTPGDILYDASTAETWNTATTGWTHTENHGTFGADGTGLTFTSDAAFAEFDGFQYRAAPGSYGIWTVDFQYDNYPFANSVSGIDFAFFITGISGDGVDGFVNSGYLLQNVSRSHVGIVKAWTLFRVDPHGSTHVLASTQSSPITDANPHSLKITRDGNGLIQVFLDGSATPLLSATDATYTVSAFFGYDATMVTTSSPTIAAHIIKDDFKVASTGFPLGTWISPVLDTGTDTIAFGLLTATAFPNSGIITYYTRSSPDNITFEAYRAVPPSGQIQSTVARYIQTKAVLDPSTGMVGNPDVADITVNWTVGAGSVKYPPTSSFTFRFDSSILEVEQEISDNLGGDTSILNDISVQAQPLVLTGADADTVWQGTIGTPPAAISGTDPLSVFNGQTLIYSAFISGGMDTAHMAGANPAAAVVTFGSGGTGSWSFSSIHPTRPVLKIVITHDGTITDLRLAGKRFISANYIQVQLEQSASSIALYGDRQLSLANSWIVGSSVADTIAKTILANFKLPTSYLPALFVRPTWNVQLADRVTVVDTNLDLTADYIVVGLEHGFKSGLKGGDIGTQMVLIKVPG